MVVDQKACLQKKCPLRHMLFCFLPNSIVSGALAFGSSALVPSSISQWADTPAPHQVAFMTQAGRVSGSSNMYRAHNAASKGPRTLKIKKTEARQMSVHTDDLAHATWPCREAELQVRRWTDNYQGRFPLSIAYRIMREPVRPRAIGERHLHGLVHSGYFFVSSYL